MQEKEKDLTSEVPTKFSKLSGWKPVTDFCSNFGCSNLLSFWTLEDPTIFSKLSGWKPVTDFCLKFGCPNLFVSFWTESVFSNGLTVE